ncbi:MAG TPA: TCP-1/cpn60 chaperonin family protein, partial [Anaerolineae bacterium]
RRYVAAGGNPMLLRTALERGLRAVHDALGRYAEPLDGRPALAKLAETICSDPPLAAMLGEVMDLLGRYGYLELRPGQGRELHREYVEGAYWESGWIAPQVASDPPGTEIRLYDAAILVGDLQIDDVPSLADLLEQARRHGCRSLVIVAHSLSETALALLRLNRERGGITCLPVKVPSGAPGQAWAMEDLATLTGARILISEAGMSLEGVRWEDLGHARRAWATADHFGVAGGSGDPAALGRHIERLRQALPKFEDEHLHGLAQARIGRLLGGAALIWVGAETESALTLRKDLAERTIAALRGALTEGVVPGGGCALLAARQDLQRDWPGIPFGNAAEAGPAALRILQAALAAPVRAILANAGYEPNAIVPEIEAAGLPYGFDVLSGQIVDLRQAGIVDVVTVLRAALHTAVSTAALALTTGALVHVARPQQSLEP